ncbi:hypothetical protein [Stappia sp.]|uniref:hypothetical protein n=1 Tax=Stappia sp. TaxID=1870903 RepID=UPI003A99C22A
MPDPAPLLSSLLALQAPGGAFPSQVEGASGTVADETCFVTAQVALILARMSSAPDSPVVSGGPVATGRLAEALHRALDFVGSCESPDVPGAFRFYPAGLATPRLPIELAADADDTALAWMALVAGGRRSHAEAGAALLQLLPRFACGPARRGDPPFVRAPLLRTWVGGGEPDPVDLIVNINMAAALALCAPASDPAVGEAAEAIAARVVAAFAGHEPDRSLPRAFAPYYANPAEAGIALERALDCGAAGLAPLGPRLLPLADRDREAGRPASRPLYCNAHGRPLWRAPALQLARHAADTLALSFDQPFSPPSISGGSHDFDAQVRPC